MSVALANEVRPAETPIYCSACFGQYPDKRHVDLDAACDRGFGEGPLPVSMDDLILCEDCLREAAEVIGMRPDDEVRAERDKYKRLFEEEQRLRVKAEGYANRMEEALIHRPGALKVSKPRGRPPREEQ